MVPVDPPAKKGGLNKYTLPCRSWVTGSQIDLKLKGRCWCLARKVERQHLGSCQILFRNLCQNLFVSVAEFWWKRRQSYPEIIPRGFPLPRGRIFQTDCYLEDPGGAQALPMIKDCFIWFPCEESERQAACCKALTGSPKEGLHKRLLNLPNRCN